MTTQARRFATSPENDMLKKVLRTSAFKACLTKHRQQNQEKRLAMLEDEMEDVVMVVRRMRQRQDDILRKLDLVVRRLWPDNDESMFNVGDI